MANGAVFDITGGVLTAVGVLFAGVTLGLNRTKVIAKFEEEIIKGREKLREEVYEKLSDYTTRIRTKIESNFFEFDQLLEREGLTIMRVNKVQEEIKEELGRMIR